MNRYILALFVAVSALLVSCENDENFYSDEYDRLVLGSYDEYTSAGKTYRLDTLTFSFRLYEQDIQEYTVYLKALVIGRASEVDRTFTIKADENGTNVPADCFKIGTTSVPANAYETVIPVTIKRTVPGMDLTDGKNNRKAHLTLQLVPDDNFQLGPDSCYNGSTRFDIYWCDFLTQPASWTDYVTQYIGPFSQARYQFFIETTGKTEFTDYPDGASLSSLCSQLRSALKTYNASHDEPYKDDDGSDLTF